MHAMTVAVDLAKTVFELAVANGQWRLTARHRFNRRQFARFLSTTPATHIVMEACGTAHYWGRVAQGHGHRVTLVPPAYVRPYVRRNKTDRCRCRSAARGGAVGTDAECAGQAGRAASARRPASRAGAVMKTRTARINTLRGILREHGLLLPAGPRAALQAVPAILKTPSCCCRCTCGTCWRACARRSAPSKSESRHSSATCGPSPTPTRSYGACARSRHWALDRDGPGRDRGAYSAPSDGLRQFASWLGLTPREHSSGHRRRLGGITKHGDRYLRCLLTHGARAVLISAQRQRSRAQPLSRLHHWAVTLRDRRGHNKATIAVANKLGRLAWAVWAKDVPYTMPRAA